MRTVTPVASKKPSRPSPTLPSEPWIGQELAASRFKDVRLAKRLHKLVAMMSGQIGKSVPCACQDWANTKAAYRFFDNGSVSEDQILSGHFQATATRLADAGGRILMLHDTCEFSFQRDQDSALGLIGRAASGKGKDGRQKHFTVRGVLMHSSLAVTTDGLPLGLTAIKFWSRRQFKGCNSLKRKVNPTRVPIMEKESYRWLENLR
jgi:Transposase DNA-binding